MSIECIYLYSRHILLHLQVLVKLVIVIALIIYKTCWVSIEKSNYHYEHIYSLLLCDIPHIPHCPYAWKRGKIHLCHCCYKRKTIMLMSKFAWPLSQNHKTNIRRFISIFIIRTQVIRRIIIPFDSHVKKNLYQCSCGVPLHLHIPI